MFKSWLSKWLKTTVLSLIISNLAFAPLTAQAFQLIEVNTQNNPVKINKVTSSTASFNPTDSTQAFTIDYCLNAKAKVTVGIYQAEGTSSSKKVALLTNQETKEQGCYSISWNGKYGPSNEVGITNTIVSDGNYFYYIKVEGIASYSTGSDSFSNWLTVTSDTSSNGTTVGIVKIINVELENSIFDPYSGQKAEFTFTINQAAYITLEIFQDDNEKVATLADNKWYEKGEFKVEWDGRDKFGEIVPQDEYTYKLKASTTSTTDKFSGTIIVKKGFDPDPDSTIDPRIKSLYVTKEKFDPGRNEKTQIVFELTAKADLQVAIYDERQQKKIVELVDKKGQQPGIYVVNWDGSEVLSQKKAKFIARAYAKNDKGEDVETVKVQIEEDEEDNKKPNIFRDKADQTPYNPKQNDLAIEFNLEKDADVTLEIFIGSNKVASVAEELPMTEGAHGIFWDGRDKFGQIVDDAIYNYRLEASNKKGKDTEIGNFSVTGSSKADPFAQICGGFSDLPENYQYCDAIEWAKQENIFDGYSDGTFKPNQAISRAEALKVILEALNVKTVDVYAEKLGFTDTSPTAWYVPYLKTGLALGVIKGYSDGSFRPKKSVNRVEALTMLLKTAQAKFGLIIPSNVYGQPYYDTPDTPANQWYLSYVWFAREYSLTDSEIYFFPGDPMTRGEMADMLYRFHLADLDQ